MDNEKKIKLEELPDTGSEPDKLVFTALPKSRPEPRLENLKTLSDSERADALGQRWLFDRPMMQWGWLFFLVSLGLLEYCKDSVLRTLIRFNFDAPELTYLMRHPLILALLIPFLFKFKTSANDFFEITFNGIDGVKTINVHLYQAPLRIKMKWGDIKAVKKICIKGRDVLELYNLEGPEAQLIWDIDVIKKKVVKQVLKCLVSNKHPLRIFIEKEVA